MTSNKLQKLFVLQERFFYLYLFLIQLKRTYIPNKNKTRIPDITYACVFDNINVRRVFYIKMSPPNLPAIRPISFVVLGIYFLFAVDILK